MIFYHHVIASLTCAQLIILLFSLVISIQKAASEAAASSPTALPPLPPKTRTPSVSSIYDNHRVSESDTSSVFADRTLESLDSPEVSYSERKYGSSSGFRSASFSSAQSPSIRVRFLPSATSGDAVESEMPLRVTNDVSGGGGRTVERFVSCEAGARSASFSVTKSMSEESQQVLVQRHVTHASNASNSHFLLNVSASGGHERRLSHYDNFSERAGVAMTSSTSAATARDEFASVTQQISQLAFNAHAHAPDLPQKQRSSAHAFEHLSASSGFRHQQQQLRSSLASAHNTRQEMTSSATSHFANVKQKRCVRFADFDAPVTSPTVVLRASRSNYEFSHSQQQHNVMTSSAEGDRIVTSSSATQFEQQAYSSMTATSAHASVTSHDAPPPLPPKQGRHDVKSYMQIFGAPVAPDADEGGEEAAAQRHSRWLREIMPPLYYFQPNLSAHLSAISGFHATPFPTLQVPDLQVLLPGEFSDDSSSRASDVFSIPSNFDDETQLQLTPPFPRKFTQPEVCLRLHQNIAIQITRFPYQMKRSQRKC